MNKLKKGLIGLLATITLSMSFMIPVQAQPTEAPMTQVVRSQETTYDNVVMVYMVGSDLESEDQSGVDDLKEMMEAKFGKNNIIVVQTGGSTKWHRIDGIKISNKHQQRYIIHNGKMSLVEEFKDQSMGEAQTLKEFVNYVQKNYPGKAEHLVLWSHGAGPVYGFGTDDNYEGDALNLEELQTALTGTKKIETIIFDACLMGSLETAYTLKSFANYMLSSSELAPGEGLDYTAFIENIERKDMKDNTKEELKSFTAGLHDTLSLVDLSKIGSVMNEVSKVVQNNTIQDIRAAAIASIAYGGTVEEDLEYDDDFVTEASELYDLNGILSQLKGSEKAVDLLNQAIVAKYTSEAFEQASGLSLYVPVIDQTFTPESANSNMDEINLPNGYLEYVLQVAQLADVKTELNYPVPTSDYGEFDWSDDQWYDEAEACEWSEDYDWSEETDNFIYDLSDEELEAYLVDQYDNYEDESFVQGLIEFVYSILFE